MDFIVWDIKKKLKDIENHLNTCHHQRRRKQRIKRVSLWLTHFNKTEMKVACLLRSTETWITLVESSMSTIFSHYKYIITQSFENRFVILLKMFRYDAILSYPCCSYLKADCWKPPSNVQFQYIIHKMLHVSPWPTSTSQSYQSLGHFYKPEILFWRSAKSWVMDATELLHWHKSTAAPTVIVTCHSQPLLLEWCHCIRWNHPQATVAPQIAANSIF